jgi:hypothetical protein
MRAPLVSKFVLLVALWCALPASAQEALPAPPAPAAAPEPAKVDAPTEAKKLEPAPAPHPTEPFVTSAFAYGARRAWFNGTRLLGGGMYYQGGYVYGLGGTVRADGVAPFAMNGLRIVERHGFISAVLGKIVAGVVALFGVVGSAAANTTKTYEGYYTDDGRTFVVERTRITATEAQQKAFEGDTQAMRDLVDSVGPGQVAPTDDFGTGLWTDLTVYDARLALLNKTAPAATGYELSFGADLRLGSLFDLPVVLDVGLATASIHAPRVDGSRFKTYLYDCFGVMGRLHVPLSRFITFSLEWTLNFFALGYLTAPDELAAEGRVVSMPVKANLEVHLTDRFFARGSVVLGGLGFVDGKLGYGLDVGVRL